MTTAPAAPRTAASGPRREASTELQDGMNLIGISANPYFLILGAAIVVSMIANVYLSRLRRAGKT